MSKFDIGNKMLNRHKNINQDLCFKMKNKNKKWVVKMYFLLLLHYILELRIQSLEMNAELIKEDLC